MWLYMVHIYIIIYIYRYYPCIVQIWKEPEEVCTNPNSRQVAKHAPAPSRCQPRDNCAAENFPVSSLAAEPLVPNGAHGDRTGAQFAIQNLVSLVLDVIWCYSLQSSTFWEVNHLSRCHISHLVSCPAVSETFSTWLWLWESSPWHSANSHCPLPTTGRDAAPLLGRVALWRSQASFHKLNVDVPYWLLDACLVGWMAGKLGKLWKTQVVRIHESNMD
jgi:hypothetical protein